MKGEGEGEGEKKSVIFQEGAIKIIEDFRRGQKKIPSFSEAVNELILKGGNKKDEDKTS